MKYLVFCSCGHALDRHSTEGCGGENAPCRCRRDQDRALETAIDDARTHPWGSWQPNGREVEVA